MSGITFHDPNTISSPENFLLFNKSIDLNNDGYQASNRGDHKLALEKYKAALAIKEKLYGPVSLHLCISLSGLADAYLSLNDLANSKREANRMLFIAESIQNSEQIRIAKEILRDVEKAEKKK